MPTLLDLSEDMRALDDLLAENGGDISDPAVEAAITEWEKELGTKLDAKVDAYAAFVTELLRRAEARKAEADRLYGRAKTDNGTAAWLKSRLKSVMEQRGFKKVETARYTVSVQANGGKLPLIIEEGTIVPPDWTRTPAPVPDTDKIREYLEHDFFLPFARLGERGTSLRIR